MITLSTKRAQNRLIDLERSYLSISGFLVSLKKTDYTELCVELADIKKSYGEHLNVLSDLIDQACGLALSSDEYKELADVKELDRAITTNTEKLSALRARVNSIYTAISA